jgi:hypothetical protein
MQIRLAVLKFRVRIAALRFWTSRALATSLCLKMYWFVTHRPAHGLKRAIWTWEDIS